jgi:hypothetical protein
VARNHKIDADAVLARVQREGPDSRVTRGEALALLDLLRPGDGGYERRKAMGNTLDRARPKRGESETSLSIAPEANGGYIVSNIAHWASAKFQVQLSDLPRRPVWKSMTFSLTDNALAGEHLETASYPGTLEQCHVAMRQMYTKIRELEQELAAKDPAARQALVRRFSKQEK